TLHLRADRKFALRINPRIGERLLQAESDAACFRLSRRLDRKNHGIHAVARFEQVRRMADFFHPRHFRNVDHALDARLDLNKRSEIRDAGNRSADALALPVTLGNGLPRLRLELLEAERNLAIRGVDLENANLNLL